MADNQGLLELSDEQREELRGWAQSRSLLTGYVLRARLILGLADVIFQIGAGRQRADGVEMEDSI